MTPSDPNDPKLVSPSVPDEATCYRAAPADPDATGQPPEVATQYHAASTDPEATGYTPTPVASRRPAGRQVLPCRFGDYELVERIARGGMGVVYKARQQIGGGERLVALKMIEAGRLASPEAVERFLREAQAAATLDHPGIVPIYDIGEAEDQHYFTMQLLPGGNLAERVREGPLPPGVAVRTLRQVAEAVQYAHERGIIHRDLKPANILLASGGSCVTPGSTTPGGSHPPLAGVTTPGGSHPPLAADVPKVTDFGLARTGESGLSVTGEALGTPSYMPPEQARGQLRVMGPASDVYGLGAVLYCLLTGRPPFQASDNVETMRQVCDEEPVPPRQLNPGVPRDLETVCLKCLQKEPGKRYPSAAELAEELGRFERGEPVRARPVGRIERAWRWCKRNPALAVLTAGAATLLLFAAVSATVAAALFNAKANAEAQARAVLEEQQYDNYIAVAERELTLNNDVGLATDLLERCPEHLRGWEWDYLMRLRDGPRAPLAGPDGHDGGLWMAEFSPDGRRLVTASIDGTAKVWDVTSGRVLLTFRGHALLKLSVPGVPRVPVMCVSFSPDGRHIASGSFSPQLKLKESRGVVKVWDAQTGREVVHFQEQLGVVLSLAYSPDGRRIASSSINNDNTFVVWDVKTGAVIQVIHGHTSHVHKLRYSPDGRLLASGSTDGTVKLWDAAALEEVLSIHAHPAPVVDVAFAPGGDRFASAGEDGTTRVWETATGAPALTLRGHTGSTLGVAYSPDGKRIATAGFDKTVRLWDAATGKEKMTLRGHKDTVWGVTFSPDGRQLVSASFDKEARIWDATPREESEGPGLFTLRDHTHNVNGVAFSRDRRYLASGSWDYSVRLWDGKTGAALRALEGHKGAVWGVAFSPDGERLASASWDHKVKVWETATGRELLTFSGHTAPVQGIAFSPDGRRLASASWDATVKIWDAATGEVKATCEGGLFPTIAVAFSPDGKRVASGRSDRNVMLWDADTGKELLTLKGHKGTVPCVVFSPDGNRLASASWDHTVKVWDVSPGSKPLFYDRALLTIAGHEDRANGVAFSPDGSRIATASEDKTVRVWDAKTGQEVLAPFRHRGLAWSVAFDPGGKRVAVGCWGRPGWVKTWNVSDK
ncbi:MAG: protein kinase [Planctomycetes bacterium]|nr:protein kinase [Planctomycetota bacterium]